MGVSRLEIRRRWAVRPDPEDRGLAERWQVDPPTDGWVACPIGSWHEAIDHDGVAWYRRRVRIPKKWIGPHQRVWIRFESVATDCTLWINGIEIGHHVGDWVPFQFDITGALEGERVEIVARVDQIRGARPEVVGRDPWIGHVTKGFHDVLSRQHAGLWDMVTLFRTGHNTIAHVVPDRRGVTIELEDGWRAGRCLVRLGELEATASIDGSTVRVDLDTSALAPWSPTAPVSHDLHVIVEDDASGRYHRSDEHRSTFGLRTVSTGGEGNGRILVNGAPVQIRGVLHWGHEPAHIAPAATEDEIRAEFEGLRARGFNLVCVCMWYPPEVFYRVASETGMMLWQIHPVWKSDMGDEHVDDYRAQYEDFFRRDALHEAVVMVSGACEHERFHPDLAAWWWSRSNKLLPDVLRQTQTAFFEWVNPEQNDLLDEHTYDSCGRWPFYLDDVQAHLDTFEPRPFLLGESIVFNSWTNPADFEGHEEAWWRPNGLEACAALERAWTDGLGVDLDRFRMLADRQNLLARKFQYEIFRTRARHAGVVMNAVRDVAQCRCGMRDELDRWRFAPADFEGWFEDVSLVLRTPDDVRGVTGGVTPVRIVVSNGSVDDLDGVLSLDVDGRPHETSLRIRSGACVEATFDVELSEVNVPTPIDLVVRFEGARNTWRLWNVPSPSFPQGVVRAAPEDHWADVEPTFEERKYSSGWGLPIVTWAPTRPAPEIICPEVPLHHEGPTVRITPVLDADAFDRIRRGVSLVHLASEITDSLATTFFQMFEQVPLVVERGPLVAGDADWIVDLLHFDLTRGATRCHAPAFEVMPVLRLVLVHDKVTPRIVDLVSAVRVDGAPVVFSSVDHSTVGGRYLLDRLVSWLAEGAPGLGVTCTVDDVRSAMNGRQAL